MIEVGSYYRDIAYGIVYKVTGINLEEDYIVATFYDTNFPLRINFQEAVQDFVELTPLEVELL